MLRDGWKRIYSLIWKGNKIILRLFANLIENSTTQLLIQGIIFNSNLGRDITDKASRNPAGIELTIISYRETREKEKTKEDHLILKVELLKHSDIKRNTYKQQYATNAPKITLSNTDKRAKRTVRILLAKHCKFSVYTVIPISGELQQFDRESRRYTFLTWGRFIIVSVHSCLRGPLRFNEICLSSSHRPPS